jgi:DNA-binding FadR family transcriptional regulator
VLGDETLHEQVLDQWGMAIVERDWAPGDRVALADLVGQVDASRTVTREATRVLEALGMVTVRRRLGALVNPPEAWNAFDPRVIGWRLRSKIVYSKLDRVAQVGSSLEPLEAELADAEATPE